jgi:hypothetical protein
MGMVRLGRGDQKVHHTIQQPMSQSLAITGTWLSVELRVGRGPRSKLYMRHNET